MAFWLDLFTGTTWDEFRKHGAKVTGFRPRMRGYLHRVQPGDIFLCYLTKVMRFVGALEVLGPSEDKSRIWKHDEYPVRFSVKPLILLDAENGIPMETLQGQVDFYPGPEYAGKFKGFLRRSPNLFTRSIDGDLIMNLFRQAENNPVKREVDQSKLYPKRLYETKRKKGKLTVTAVVSVPEPEEAENLFEPPKESSEDSETQGTKHTEVQYELLKLGSDMGFNLWVARNDRGRNWNGKPLGQIRGIINELPTQFNEVTNKTIELIDVLWLKGNSFVAAFEIECTTSIYSGLLRMSDLMALQPNLNMKLYLVAPDERRQKVEQEVLRPTFTLREKPLSETCGFISFSKLMEKIKGIKALGLVGSLKPDFLEQMAEYFNGSV